MNNTPEFEIENGVLVKYLGDGEEVTVPKCVTSIGDHAFNGCSSLTSIVNGISPNNPNRDAYTYAASNYWYNWYTNEWYNLLGF